MVKRRRSRSGASPLPPARRRSAPLAAGLAALVALAATAGCAELPESPAPSDVPPSPALSAAPAPPLPSWRALLERGRAALAAERLERAVGELERALGMNPWSEEARGALEEARGALFRRSLERADELEAKHRPVSARRELLRAIRARPGDASVAARLRRGGLRPWGEEWLTRDEITRGERAEERRAARRARELEIPERFRLWRRRGFRIWSDHRSGELVPFTWRLLDLLEGEERAYRELFRGLGPIEPASGVDVIVFAHRGDYTAWTGREGTAGIFLPERRVSCFWLPRSYREEGREAFLREVFLHEITHQLDVVLLGIRYPPRWLQEGLAVHFESARLDPRGRRILELGAAPSAALRRAAEAARPGGERWLGIAAIASTSAEELLSARSERLHSFYAQAWLLVRFLLEGGARGRAVLLDLVETARRRRAPPEPPGSDFSRILERSGATIEMMERELRADLERRGIPPAR